MATPDGVCKYDGTGKQDGNKGRFQPDSVNAGRSGNGSYNGGPGKATKLASGGANAIPAGVHKHSGTEPLGAPVQHKNAAKSGPGSAAGTSAIPEGVHKHSGLSAGKASHQRTPAAPPER